LKSPKTQDLFISSKLKFRIFIIYRNDDYQAWHRPANLGNLLPGMAFLAKFPGNTGNKIFY
jgi:hypothetical protein